MSSHATHSTPAVGEDDMTREVVSLPEVYGYPDDKGWAPPICWYCQILDCCCGCVAPEPQPCMVRFGNCVNYYVLAKAGAYIGAQKPFDRKVINKFLGANKAKAGHNTKANVTSVDMVAPSTYVAGLKIPVRIFEHEPSKTSTKPIVMYIHGGGWVCGSNSDVHYHRLCSLLAEKVNCIVVSVDYRLAPENKFPAALEDCFDVMRWISNKPSESYFKNADFQNLMLIGDSAGGNLSLVMSTLVRDKIGAALEPCELDVKITAQVLLCPALFMRRFVKEPLPKDNYFLSKHIIEFYYEAYIPGNNREDVRLMMESDRRICPVLAGFHNLPKTLLIDGDLDNLSKENKIAVEAMKKNGSHVEYHCWKNQVHAFVIFLDIKASKDAIALVTRHMRDSSVSKE